MKFSFTVKVWKWVLEITIDLFDFDPSDRTLGFGIYISW